MLTSKIRVEIDTERLAVICKQYNVSQIWAFGSVLRDDFNAQSDIDILVEFLPDARITLYKFQQLREELEALFGRKVDLVDKKGIEERSNRLRKEGILGNTLLLYSAERGESLTPNSKILI